MKKALLYMIAYDAPGEAYYRCLAKMGVCSLVAAGWPGQVLLISNGRHRIFDRPPPRLREECISTDGQTPGGVAESARVMKMRAAELIRAQKYSHIVYADADILFNASIAEITSRMPGLHVAREHWIRRAAPSRAAFFSGKTKPPAGSSPDAGFWIVDAESYGGLMREWALVYQSLPAGTVIEKRDRHAWNFLLTNTAIPVHDIHTHRVLYPLAGDA